MLEINKTYKDRQGHSVTIVASYSAPPHTRFVGVLSRPGNDPIPVVYTSNGKRTKYNDDSGGVSASRSGDLIDPNTTWLVLGTKCAAYDNDRPPACNPILELTYNDSGQLVTAKIVQSGSTNIDWRPGNDT